MCYRVLRMLLLVVGCVLVFVAGFPLLLLWHVHLTWETEFMAAKLLMLPVGALCLVGAAAIPTRYLRR